MVEISDVRDLFFSKLNTWAGAQLTPLRIEIAGEQFKPGNLETWITFAFLVAEPSKPYAGTWYISKEKGICQIQVLGPESRKQKAFEKIAWDIREEFWPTGSQLAPTLGSSPLVRLGPTAPHVVDHPAPDAGRLGSILTLQWHSDFQRA